MPKMLGECEGTAGGKPVCDRSSRVLQDTKNLELNRKPQQGFHPEHENGMLIYLCLFIICTFVLASCYCNKIPDKANLKEEMSQFCLIHGGSSCH
jgi:hypothetical protein